MGSHELALRCIPVYLPIIEQSLEGALLEHIPQGLEMYFVDLFERIIVVLLVFLMKRPKCHHLTLVV